jgi:hypothetical protein
MYELHLSVLVHETIPCGTAATHNNAVSNLIHGLRHLLLLVFAKYLSLWTSNQYVHL